MKARLENCAENCAGRIARTARLSFTHHASPAYGLALLPDGLRFVSGSYDHTARIVEIGPLPQ